MSDAQTNMTYLPGWTTKIYEITNGVYNVILRDSYGRLAEITDIATEQPIVRAVGYAFDIEKQISKNWDLFLYDLAQLLLDESKITSKMHDDETFGSWYIELKGESRIVYDGKDGWLIFQRRISLEWIDQLVIKREELTYANLANLINKVDE